MSNYAQLEVSLTVPQNTYKHTHGVPSQKVQGSPKVFLKKIEQVDLSIFTGFAAQGKFVNRDYKAGSSLRPCAQANKDMFCYNYNFLASDKEVYTFGITLERQNPKGAQDYGRKIAVIFTIEDKPSTLYKAPGNAVSFSLFNDIELVIKINGICMQAVQVFENDPAERVPYILSSPDHNMIAMLDSYAHAFAKANNLNESKMVMATNENPYYCVAVMAHSYAYGANSSTKFAEVQDVTGKNISGITPESIQAFEEASKLAGKSLEELAKSFGVAADAISGLSQLPDLSVSPSAWALSSDQEKVSWSHVVGENDLAPFGVPQVEWDKLSDEQKYQYAYGKKWVSSQQSEREAKENIVVKTVKKLIRKVAIKIIGDDNQEQEVSHTVGGLPNGWEWVANDTDGVILIARNGKINFLHALANEGRLSEEVIQLMLDQAVDLESIAQTYRLIAYAKLPEARLEKIKKQIKAGDNHK